MDMFDRMDELIKNRGWTRSEFLRRIGLNPSAMKDWRLKKSSPEKHMKKIESVLCTTEAYLRGETDDSWQPAEINLDEVDAIEIEYLQFAREARKLGQAEQDIVKRIIKTAIEAGLKAQEDEDNKR